MMRSIAIVFSILISISITYGQIPIQVDSALSSEWEATGFNNGRRMVRDADGYFHVVFHSQAVPAALPGNPAIPPFRPAGIYYTHSLLPADGLTPNPPPWTSLHWASPTAVAGTDLDGVDDRYPAIAIEYDAHPANPLFPLSNDRLHIVWQRESEEGSVYDIAYSTRPNEPAPPPDQTGWQTTPSGPTGWRWLYQSWMEGRNSLVPAICVGAGNAIHVVWQEENYLSPDGSNFYSEILYKGSAWPNWLIPNAFDDNVSALVDGNPMLDFTNSQMPSIACAHDLPADFAYLPDVFVTWNDDYVQPGSPIMIPPHIWLNVNGMAGQAGFWNNPIDVSAMASTGADGYPNIAVSRTNNFDHIVYMSEVTPNDPDGLIPGRGGYSPGVNPLNMAPMSSFPGPNPGMYGVSFNGVFYASVGGVAFGRVDDGVMDSEFPTISCDMINMLHVCWQGWTGSDYEIVEDFSPIPGSAWMLDQILPDPNADDLFPNLAFKKVGMYPGGGRDLVWTRIVAGHGVPAAIQPVPKMIYFSGNSIYSNPVPATSTPAVTATPTPTLTPTGEPTEPPPFAEFGDAPDSTKALMIAYPASSTMARFPTQYNTLYGIGSPFGANHLDAAHTLHISFPGIQPTNETDADDLLTDQDGPGQPNINPPATFFCDNDSVITGGDDGASFVWAAASTISVRIISPGLPAILNVLFDMNRDGDWGDIGEWVVQNSGSHPPGIVTLPVPYPGPGPIWIRVTVTDMPITHVTPWDGTAPLSGSWFFGETEDYRFDIADIPATPTPTSTPTATPTTTFTPTPSPTPSPTSPPVPVQSAGGLTVTLIALSLAIFVGMKQRGR